MIAARAGEARPGNGGSRRRAHGQRHWENHQPKSFPQLFFSSSSSEINLGSKSRLSGSGVCLEEALLLLQILCGCGEREIRKEEIK